MIRMVAEVAECTGTLEDIKASEQDHHWCEQCRGTGWNVMGQPFQLTWVPHWWPWGKTHGTWRSMIQAKSHD